MITAISKWGNGHAIRLSKSIMSQANLSPDDRLSVTVEKECITLRKLPVTKAERFASLFSDYHGDWQCSEIDTACDMGKEVIE